MSIHDEAMEMFDEMRKKAVNVLLQFNAMIERQYACLDCVENDIEEFKKNGTLTSTFQNMKLPEPQPENNVADSISEKTKSMSSSSIKENSIAPPTTVKRQTRRNVLQETVETSNINSASQDTNKEPDGIAVKTERVTNAFAGTDVTIKSETNMPPPGKPALRSKNVRKRKNENQEINIKKEVLDTSVIEVQKAPIEVITLEDSFDTPEKPRVTRARTKVKKVQENQDSDQNIENNTKLRKTRTKRKRVDNPNSEEESHSNNEDAKVETEQLSKKRSNAENKNSNINKGIAESELQAQQKRAKKDTNKNSIGNTILTSTPILDFASRPNLNETLVITNPINQNHQLLNETVVIEKPTAKQPLTIDDLMTDDEDIVDESPLRKTRQKKPKQVFSPYENSPVKKRVEAFEKLGATNLEVAGTTTRSRKKVNGDVRNDSTTSSNSSTQIPRLFGTPLRDSKFKHLQTMSASKPNSNTQLGSYNTLTGGKKTGSALKASQMEFRERELRRKQKEAEAMQKKEALIQAQTEEKRRKREERELKVQQQKLAMEKDKQKQLESTEKAKDDKLKQALAEKEAKFFKQKEEAARKRAAALKKAAELKLQEEANYKQKNNQKVAPMYLTHETPLLPTPDCYDSDDSTSRSTFVIPEWQSKTRLHGTLLDMQSLPPHTKMLFASGPETPNLKAIFPMIEPAKLKRTSSAIWNKTEMSILESMIEED